MSKEKKSKETTGQETMNQDQEPKNHEIKLQEIKRPENLRANVRPIDGYVLSVDGKLKKRYESSQGRHGGRYEAQAKLPGDSGRGL